VGPAGGEALSGARRAARRLGGAREARASRASRWWGHQWSAETQTAKQFLARNQVPFRHLDVRGEQAQRLLATASRDQQR
jgi:hypothetical protein